jgi:hypothetical protein
MTTKNVVTFKVEQNKIWGDFRVEKYLNGKWINGRDNNWSKAQAKFIQWLNFLR